VLMGYLWWRIFDEPPTRLPDPPRSSATARRAASKRNQTQSAAVSSAANTTINDRPGPLKS
jgi:hypothetical protein